MRTCRTCSLPVKKWRKYCDACREKVQLKRYYKVSEKMEKGLGWPDFVFRSDRVDRDNNKRLYPIYEVIK